MDRTSGGLEFPTESDVPPLCLSEPCCMGIDEAGRGPTLGPMVYGTCYCPVSQKTAVKALGFDDSKVLTEEARDEFFAQIKDRLVASGVHLGWIVRALSPEEISGKMLRVPKYNLNDISHDTAIELIRSVLSKGVNVTEVFVDTVGDPAKYELKLSKLFPGISIAVRKKADSLYPVVSAASICAKVTRDFIVSNWVFREAHLNAMTHSFGSGYPSDPASKKWLLGAIDHVFGFPSFVRFSWAPARKLLADKAAAVAYPYAESSDDEDGDNEGAAMELDEAQPAMTSFFRAAGVAGDAGAPAAAARGPKRGLYYRDRALVHITSFQ